MGNQQGNGYVQFMLHCIEQDAMDSGAKGVAAWGMDFPQWNPVSFYEHAGYSRVDSNRPVVLVWKPFAADAQPPALLHPARTLQTDTEKIRVTVFINGWCGVGCHWCAYAREAVKGLEEHVLYEEIDTSDRATMLSWGVEDGVLLNGKWFGGPPWRSEDLRAEILRLSNAAGEKRD